MSPLELTPEEKDRLAAEREASEREASEREAQQRIAERRSDLACMAALKARREQ